MQLVQGLGSRGGRAPCLRVRHLVAGELPLRREPCSSGTGSLRGCVPTVAKFLCRVVGSGGVVAGQRVSLTTHVAVFQDDLIRTYRTFVDNRRTGRPPQEYREPTDAEWEEFEEHFTLRRVELGSCARPYGSRCEHEHACLRCPVLRVDPAQLDRLAAIITNLEERIVEAEERGWPGEVAQLTVTVKAARDKLARHTPPGRPRPTG